MPLDTSLPESASPRTAALLDGLSALFRRLHASATVAARLDVDATQASQRLAFRTARRRAAFEITTREALPGHEADVALALRALQGDAAAVREVRAQVEGLVISRIHARGLGAYEDELLGLIMSRLWDKLALYKGRASLRTWSWTVADRFLRNWLRDRKVEWRRLATLDGAGDVPGGVKAEHLAAGRAFEADQSLLADERAREARWLVERIHEVAERQIATRRLRAADWHLVQQVVVNGEHYDALAREHGTTPGNLRVRVFRALESLRGPLRTALGRDVEDYFGGAE